MLRRWIWITPLSLVILIMGAWLLATPLAKREAHKQAEARGLKMEIGSLSLGFFHAELRDVRLRPEGVDGVDAFFKHIEVDLAVSAPRVRRLFVKGGEVEIEGDIDSVQEKLSAWRARRSTSRAIQEPTKERRVERVRNVNVTWRGALDKDDIQKLKGLNIDRDAEGQRLGIDLVEVSLGALTGEVAGTLVTIPGPGLTLDKSQVRFAEARLAYHATENDPSPLQKQKPAVAPLLAPQKPPPPPGLGQRLEKDDARVAKLRAALTLLRDRALGTLPPKIKVDRFWLTYLRGRDKLHVGPSLLEATQGDGSLVVTISPRAEATGTPLSMRFALNPVSADHAASLAIKGGPVSLSTLGIEEGAFGLQGVAHTRLSGNALIQLSQDARTVSGEGESSVSDLTLESTRLSEQLISFPSLRVTGSGLFAVDGSHYQLEEARLTLGDTNFEGAFEMQRSEDFVSLNATAKAPLVSCQALVDSAPRGLLGAVERIEFDRTFSLDAGVQADSRHLSKMKVRWDFKNNCRAKRIPAELDPARFHTIFSREVVGAGNYPMRQEFGPLSGNWVSYAHLSPFIEKALLVTEDGRFFRHNGFDDRAIESAIGDNARAGRFVRGASTISMQLAKNLYLSRDKTLARKFREAALTSLLEQSFTKQEILELYVNVIEFGPGIYGIEKAAEYYFKSTAQELTAAQSFFLASILPAPSVEYFGADGTLSVRRQEAVDRLLAISHKRGALTDEELAFGQDEVLIFGQKDTTSERTSAESAAGEHASGAPSSDTFEVDPSKLDPPVPSPPRAPSPSPRASPAPAPPSKRPSPSEPQKKSPEPDTP